MATLKSLLVLLSLTASALAVTAQDYSNIEFVENKGQWDSRIKYKGEVTAGAVFIRSTGFTIVQHNQQDYTAIQAMMNDHNAQPTMANRSKDGAMILRSHAWNIDFVGASPKMQVLPDKAIPSYNNYFIGNDPSKWGANCKIYQAMTLQEVYPNVDVRYYTYNGTLKYDIIAKPGADISKIALKYEGVDKMLVRNKELVLGTSIGERRESAPFTYQSNGKERKEVNCKYIVRDNIVRFDVKGYDPTATLVIDPTLIFCSLSNSAATNWGFTATYGPDGSFYGGGIVFEGNSFPTSVGAYQTTFQGGSADNPGGIDIGIIRLSANGGNRLYATYLGGSGNEQPHSLIVDPQGNLVIAGRTNSNTDPDPNRNYPGTLIGSGGGYDIIVTKLNPTGSALVGSVRIGGHGDDGVNIQIARTKSISLQQNYGDDGRSEVITDGAGNIYVASCTRAVTGSAANDFPVTAGAFQTTFGGGLNGQDGVVLKFPPNLSTTSFASYLGGIGNDAAYVVALGGSGEIYVGGGTESNNFPGNHAGTVGPSFVGGPAGGNIDGFIARIANNGSALLNSAYIATNAVDQVFGIQFDRKGFPYIMGQTRGDMPPINAAFSNNGGKIFIAKLQPDLSAYIYRTRFGTGASLPNISPTAFLVDRCENVYVSGWGGAINQNNDFPNAGTSGLTTTPDALPYPAGGTDGRDFYFFVLRKDAAGPGPLFASFFGQGGGFTDHVDGGTSRFDQNGVIYQAVCANCNGGASFPTTPGVWGPTKPASAGCNLGMIKIAFNLAGVGSDVSSAIGGVPNDTAGCLPLDVTFTDLIRNAQEYIWDFGDGTPQVGPLPAAQGYTQTHTFQSLGTFQVMLVAINPTSCNVRDTSYTHIRVGDLKANLRLSFQKVGACTALDYQFNNNSFTDPTRPFTDSSFIWDFGDGSPTVVAGMTSVPHTFPAPGSYTVKLTLNDTAYCNNPETLDTLINVAANVKARFDSLELACAPFTAVFNNTSIGGLTFVWDFGDPASGANNTSTLANPTHIYQVPGRYNIVMVANDPNTCNKTDTFRYSLVVFDKPTSNFSYTPIAPVVNTPNVFTNLASANAVRFKWVFGDGDSLLTTSRADVTHQYNATGTFNACLVAYNEIGCSDVKCLDVSTLIVPALDVPNAFTPNSNDVNSVVMVRGFGIAKMRFTIWNRWGQKVFETGNRYEGWNGRVKGAVQPMDVYAYTLDVEFFDGTKTTKKGDITLIR